MLEEAAQYAPDTDIIAHAGNPRNEATDATDEEVNLHACLRGLAEGFDDIRVHEAIHLRKNGRLAAVLRRRGFCIDEVDDATMEVKGSHEEVLKLGLGEITGQDVKE